jgi:hypothetical protein
MAGKAIRGALPSAEHSTRSFSVRRLARRAALAALLAALPGIAAATPYELTYTTQNGDAGDLFFTTGGAAGSAALNAQGYVDISSISGTWDGTAVTGLVPVGGYGANDNLFLPGGAYRIGALTNPALTFAGVSFAAGAVDVNVFTGGSGPFQLRSDVNPAGDSSGAHSAMRSINISQVVDPHALVNVQFGVAANSPLPATPQYQGPAVLSGGANRWNLVTGAVGGANQSGSNIVLTDASGAATGIKLSYSTPLGFFNTGGAGIFGNDPLRNLLTSYLYGGYANSGPATVTLSGARPGERYELLLYSVADVTGRQTAFTVDGQTEITTAGADQLQEGARVLVEGGDYAAFFPTADASGDITVSLDGVAPDPWQEGDLDGLQLLALPNDVPEPASFLLLAGGLAGLAWCRRRDRRGNHLCVS